LLFLISHKKSKTFQAVLYSNDLGKQFRYGNTTTIFLLSKPNTK
jgi:hypothetical protein